MGATEVGRISDVPLFPEGDVFKIGRTTDVTMGRAVRQRAIQNVADTTSAENEYIKIHMG